MYDSAGEPAKHSVRGSGECSAWAVNLMSEGQLQEKTFPGERPGELRWQLLLTVGIALAELSW